MGLVPGSAVQLFCRDVTKQSHAFVYALPDNACVSRCPGQIRQDSRRVTSSLVGMAAESQADNLLRIKPLINAAILETPEIIIKELSEIAIIAESITRWRSKNDHDGDDGWKKIMDGLDREGMCWHRFMKVPLLEISQASISGTRRESSAIQIPTPMRLFPKSLLLVSLCC